MKNDETGKTSRFIRSVPDGQDGAEADLASGTDDDRYDGHLPVSAAGGNPVGARVDGDDVGADSVGGQIGGQAAETNRPPVGKSTRKRTRPPVGNVPSIEEYKRRKQAVPTGGQKKTTGGKQKTSPRLPTGGQTDETEWLKSLLPTAKTGDWWETPADDKGFKIKLRWRVGTQKGTYVFRRLGKRNIETMKEESYEQQVWLIADRIFGELRSEGRTDVAARLGARPVFNQVAGAEG